MRTAHTFAITFYLKNGKRTHTSLPLYARITINSRRTEFSLKRKIERSQWNSKKNRVIGNSAFALKVNNLIQKVYSDLFDIYEQLIREGILVTPQLIKSRYFNEDESQPTLKELIKYHFELAQSTLSPGTYKNYQATETHLLRFLNKKMKMENIRLYQLTESFITKFENYLRMHQPVDNQKKMTNNTVMKHIQRFRKMIGLAVRLEWIEKDPFANYKTKFIKKDRGFLTAMELATIEEKPFTIPRLQYVRDLFVFSCYTGLSYIDVVSLKPQNIMIGIDGGKWISIKRRKTDNAVKLPLLPNAEQLLEKYAPHPRALHKGTCFPPISNQKLNAYLKEIADLCGITKKITFHLARHTFATTVVLSNGVSLYALSKMLGHTKITTTQIYARMQDTRISEEMNGLKSKLGDNNRCTEKANQKNAS